MKCSIMRFPRIISLSPKKRLVRVDNSLIFPDASLKENMETDMLGDGGGDGEGVREGRGRESTFPTCSRNFLSGIF